MIVKNIGLIEYLECFNKMKTFTESRTKSMNEIWIAEHYSVFTLGVSGNREHVISYNHNIPIVNTDRGGQVTYHGRGQVLVYFLLDVKAVAVRKLVTLIENAIIMFLARNGIIGHNDMSAPGVYVDKKKIASIGLKIKSGFTYHGASFNINIDKIPFSYINPCGFSGLKIVNMSEFIPIKDTVLQIGNHIAEEFINLLAF